MSSINTLSPNRSTDQFTEPAAPDYAVPAPQEAWERFGWFVGKVLGTTDEHKPSVTIKKESALEPHAGVSGKQTS